MDDDSDRDYRDYDDCDEDELEPEMLILLLGAALILWSAILLVARSIL